MNHESQQNKRNENHTNYKIIYQMYRALVTDNHLLNIGIYGSFRRHHFATLFSLLQDHFFV